MGDTREQVQPKPAQQLYRELAEAFAPVLFVWRFPDVLRSTKALKDYDSEIGHYFSTDPMAHHVLRALVSHAMRLSEGADERDATQRAQVAMFELGLSDRI